jgi:hypothetical protein
MNITRMEIPRTRRAFENRMNLLEEAVRNGKFHISQNCVSLIDEIVKVRRMQNGRLDLLTVDESARLQANMMANLNIPDIEKE